LGLRFDEIELPDGTQIPLAASLTEVDERDKEKVTEEGQVEGEGSKKRDAATIGAGAGIGAVIGAIAGGGKGAAIGAGAGAAAGTGVVLATRGKDAELKRGSELAIQLDRPLSVPVK
jgi:outer membrane lipoprotein SlyB